MEMDIIKREDETYFVGSLYTSEITGLPALHEGWGPYASIEEATEHRDRYLEYGTDAMYDGCPNVQKWSISDGDEEASASWAWARCMPDGAEG